ncbi:NB-ARC domain containing protein [Trema orientale]|uniref:NB-ARC domain containing protein n=1 Tax=Trema orientale TaxID=63057 RepID=A0A2P5DAM9_TREOI|nr:NB-ARC domain containing protein [Trema orientale]
MAEAFFSSERNSLQRGLDELDRTVLTPQFGNRISDLYGLKGPVAVVKREIKRLEYWPKDAKTRVRQLISDIAEAVFELDDIVTIFGFLVDARFPGKKGSDLKEIYVPDDDDDELNKAGIEIRRLCSRVSNLRRSLDGACATWTWRIPPSPLKKMSEERQLREWRRAYSSVESIVDCVVGFEENIKVLIEQLTRIGEGDGVPRVFCVLGMGGIGKTTLAKQIYYDSEIRSHFDSFAWLSISDDEPSDRRRKFNLANEVLIQLTCAAGEAEISRVKQMNDYDSCVDLYHELRKRRFLLILDDVWSHETLEYLILNGFPKYRCNWKILVTTRKKSVADNFPVYKNIFVHQPRFLDENQSWELFEKKANFGRDAIKVRGDCYVVDKTGNASAKVTFPDESETSGGNSDLSLLSLNSRQTTTARRLLSSNSLQPRHRPDTFHVSRALIKHLHYDTIMVDSQGTYDRLR